MYYPRKRYARKAPRKPRKTANRKKPSVAVKKYVKRQISRNIEKKTIITSASNVALFSASSSTAPIYIQLCPNIAQGTGQAQRIGNEIMVKRAVIRGRVNLLEYNAITNPLKCPTLMKLWLCRRKRSNVVIAGNPSLTNFNQFFQAGSSAGGFTGTPLDMFTENNKDYWDILGVRTFQLANASSGVTLTAGAITAGAGQVSVPYTFYFNKYLGKLMYNDATSNESTNRELFLVFQAVYADGTSSLASGQAETHYSMVIEYEDA